MAYTVKKLAQLSGVSVRTLHFYDEIGLLKPARVGENQYRYYEEEQLLALQQILFFRELGFELKKIQTAVGRPGFDRVEALRAHREVLLKERARMGELISTIDQTLDKLKGGQRMKTNMKDKDLYQGFAPEKQAEYEEYIKNRFGIDNQAWLESQKNVKKFTKADWEKNGKEWDAICRDLAAELAKRAAVGSARVQAIMRRHHSWLKKFWTPNRESYAGLGAGYTGFEWKKAFAAYDREHPKLALFMADAMRVFAERELD
jgi:MerR family transcriptional regulator, thiopeptide resistance regulator